MAATLIIQNNGPEIVHTTYWQTALARAGLFFLSVNAGAFRLLVPPRHVGMVREMRTARACVVSRGPYPALGFTDGLELLFDDGTPEPLSLHLSHEAVDRMPRDADSAQEWMLSVWTHLVQERCTKVLERPCHYRRVHSLPDLRPWPQ